MRIAGRIPMTLTGIILAAAAGIARGGDPPAAPPSAIAHECVVPAERAKVFEAFSTTAGVRSFFSANARVEPRIGGPFEIYFDMSAPEGSRGSEGCRVLSLVPDEMLSFSWNAPPKWPEIRWQRTYVVVQFSDAGEKQTRVRLLHLGWKGGKEWNEVHDYFDKAWPRVLANLKKRFESGPLNGDTPPVEAPKRKHYCYFIRPTRMEMIMKPSDAERETLMGHVAYIKGLVASGRLVVAGPCMDPAQFPSNSDTARPLKIEVPGLVIFSAADDAEAKRIMEGDPAIKAGIFKACVTPFNFSFDGR